MAHEIESTEQLVVIECQNVIADVVGLKLRKLILQHTVCVELELLEATSEKSHPLLPKLKRIEIVAQVLLRNILEEKLELAVFELLVHFDFICLHTHEDFGGVASGFRRIVIQERDLIEMAEDTQFSKEVDILDVDHAIILSSLLAALFLSRRLFGGGGLGGYEFTFIVTIALSRCHSRIVTCAHLPHHGESMRVVKRYWLNWAHKSDHVTFGPNAP